MQGLSAYRIGPMDKLDVTVFQVKDLTGTVDVDASGKIALPLIGSVQAAGLTTGEVSKEIDDRLRQGYVKDPVVTVTVKEAVSQKVTVAGAVQKPGVYPITGYTTLSTAVALAQGTDPARANERKVLLIRTVGGKRMQAAYNLVDIQSGKVPDPEVYGNDTIVIGTAPAAASCATSPPPRRCSTYSASGDRDGSFPWKGKGYRIWNRHPGRKPAKAGWRAGTAQEKRLLLDGPG